MGVILSCLMFMNAGLRLKHTLCKLYKNVIFQFIVNLSLASFWCDGKLKSFIFVILAFHIISSFKEVFQFGQFKPSKSISSKIVIYLFHLSLVALHFDCTYIEHKFMNKCALSHQITSSCWLFLDIQSEHINNQSGQTTL